MSTAQMQEDGVSDSELNKKRSKLGYRRISMACAYCRRRKIRCIVDETDPQGRCQSCIQWEKECMYYPVDEQSVLKEPSRLSSEVCPPVVDPEGFSHKIDGGRQFPTLMSNVHSYSPEDAAIPSRPENSQDLIIEANPNYRTQIDWDVFSEIEQVGAQFSSMAYPTLDEDIANAWMSLPIERHTGDASTVSSENKLARYPVAAGANLKKPKEKFRDYAHAVREGIAPLKDASLSGIPVSARWTKIDRRLVTPEALEEAKERFEVRLDNVIVLRVLTKEEIQRLADRTIAIRDERYQKERNEKKATNRSELEPRLSPQGEVVVSNSLLQPSYESNLTPPSFSHGFPTGHSTSRESWKASSDAGHGVPIDPSTFAQSKDEMHPDIDPSISPDHIATRLMTDPESAATQLSMAGKGERVFSELHLQSSINDIEALLNPESYFQSLDDLEQNIIDSSYVRDIFARSPGNRTGKIHFAQLPSWTPLFLYSTLLRTIAMLEREGFCHESIILLVEDKDQEKVLNTVSIGIQEIRDMASGDNKSTLRAIALSAAKGMDAYFGVDVNRWATERISIIYCCLLLLGLVSYAGSHCSSLESTVWDGRAEEVDFHQPRTKEDKNSNQIAVSFRRQPLDCMGAFVGQPVWAFMRSRTLEPAKLCISATQLADLWGPVSIVPDGNDAENLIALKVQGGVIHRVTEQVERNSTRPNMVQMHFVATGSITGEILSDGSCSKTLGYCPVDRQRLPDVMLPFSKNAQLLIGRPPDTSTHTILEIPANQEYQASEPSMEKIRSQLHTNADCRIDKESFGRRYTHLFSPLGTQKTHYIPEEYQVNFGLQQYVNAGVTKVWKKYPESTWKEKLVEYCSTHAKPGTQIDAILELKLGLEVSMCTGNARRVTLWQALMLSHPESCSTLMPARDKEDVSNVSAYMAQLSMTGFMQAHRSLLFWPYDNGMPYVVDVSNQMPKWSNILKDTRSSACFAIMSSVCMTYRNRFRYARQACHGRLERYCESLLQTTINLHPESHPNLPLSLGTRIRLDEGFLEMKNRELAFYGETTPWNRLEEIRVCANAGRKRRVHQELLDKNRASNYTLPLLIVDESRGTARSIALELR